MSCLPLPFPPVPLSLPFSKLFFQLCFSVKTISSSPWTSARPRPCRPVSPTSTALSPWWKTGLSFYALPLPQLSLLAPSCGDQGPVTKGRVSPISNKSQGDTAPRATLALSVSSLSSCISIFPERLRSRPQGISQSHYHLSYQFWA